MHPSSGQNTQRFFIQATLLYNEVRVRCTAIRLVAGLMSAHVPAASQTLLRPDLVVAMHGKSA